MKKKEKQRWAGKYFISSIRNEEKAHREIFTFKITKKNEIEREAWNIFISWWKGGTKEEGNKNVDLD